MFEKAELITRRMQRRIKSNHISKCSLAVEIVYENRDPETGKEYPQAEIVLGYLNRYRIISNNDFVLAEQILGKKWIRELLER